MLLLAVAVPVGAVQTLKKDQVFIAPVQGQFFTDEEALVFLNLSDKLDASKKKGALKFEKITHLETDLKNAKDDYTKLKNKRSLFGKLIWAGFGVSFIAGAIVMAKIRVAQGR